MHLVVVDSSDIQLSGLQIQAPAESPNTDGIHLQRVKNAQINNCVIQTGDDCISISSGSSAINIKNIECGPGHGIRRDKYFGSYPTENTISKDEIELYFFVCSIGSLGKNGEEAKIDDILIQNITFVETSNEARIKTWQPSAAQIQNITYRNIQGTSSTNVAVNISCSETVWCTGTNLTNIEITSTTANKVKSVCAV
eukprot:PITA_31138